MLFIAQAGCPEVGPGAWAWWSCRAERAAGAMGGPPGRGGRLRARAGVPWRDGAESSMMAEPMRAHHGGPRPALPEGTLRSSWSLGPWSPPWVPRSQLPLPRYHTPSQVYSPAHCSRTVWVTWPSSSPLLCPLMWEMCPSPLCPPALYWEPEPPCSQSCCVLDAAEPSLRRLCKSFAAVTVALPVLQRRNKARSHLCPSRLSTPAPAPWLARGAAPHSYLSE